MMKYQSIDHRERIERRVVRLQRYRSNGNMTDLFEILRFERFTGSLTIEFSQGGVRAVTAQDSQPLAEPD
jgi:hypothetical protein